MDFAALFRAESARATAGLARRLGDLDEAEDAVADAFVLALERWPRDGVPHNPAGWIAVTARHRAIDRIRRDRDSVRKHERLARLDAIAPATDGERTDEDDVLGDDRLALLFACIHPALDRDAQIALTLRSLGGLTTDEIADAFFTGRTAMQQRLVRAKSKLRNAGIPFAVPPADALDDRLDAVTTVVYVIFTTGYAPQRGPAVMRPDLCESAIAIGRVLVRALPDRAAPHALDALMRFHHARRAARTDPDGNAVLLEQQDRSRWDAPEIARASESLRGALLLPRCPTTFEAYIAGAHAHAPTFAATDWDAIVAAYDALIKLHDTPVARCNRAVALAMRGDVADAARQLDEMSSDPTMVNNRYYHMACADVAQRAGDRDAARRAFARALSLAADRDRPAIAERMREL